MTRPSERYAVIVTRPAPGAEKTCRQVAASGWHVIWHPLLQIEATPRPVPSGPFTQLVVTSAQVIPALDDIARDIPVCAVGAATAARLRAHRFTNIATCAGNASSIVAHLGSVPPSGRLLFPTGAQLGLKLTRALQARGWDVVRYLTYRSRPVTSLSDSLLSQIRSGAVDAVMFFSSRTASAWVKAASVSGVDTRNLRAITLSAAIAARLKSSDWREISTSDAPDHDAILQCLGPGPQTKRDGCAEFP
ncbi:uroporphyrinogen-III synthase [Candidatus Kirkpatrickella diaphorinae]|uniref:Uroporphyrinogen-III synthase n=1 Tax=Candidatus Kirkpatrickella diaphorinae TaxID=2984322 RepID=A0ABY6GL12_9PROT|nr:uroporphyrinogen-III synthase [Candidatus Kirkpatrickella diaphorinae]UYH52140.1 uroporphyrinogen-III synthase [Candidatus Kirkpatrickella diaphorinae]